MGFIKKLIVNLILSIILSSAYVFFIDKQFELTRFLIITVIAFVILFIISLIFFSRKGTKRPKTPEEIEAFRRMNARKIDLKNAFEAKGFGREHFEKIDKQIDAEYQAALG